LRFPGIRAKAAAIACGGAFVLLAPATPAQAGTGGVGIPGSEPSSGTATVPGSKARLVRGIAIPPVGAPPRVRAVIEAANRISRHPYKWGGGHGAWQSSGYDCSGAVSYALHGGDFLDSPLDSSGFRRWGMGGRGSWISVYTHPGHAYAVIAGLRWDTSGNARGVSGPRWHKSTRAATRGRYVVRHPSGY
jgi:hypothetical protein